MYTPQQLDLVIYQGATFIKEYEWLMGEDQDVPSTMELVNLDHFIAYMQIKKDYDSSEILCDLSSVNNEILLTSEDMIVVIISGNKTALLPWKYPLLYDLKLFDRDSGYVYRVAEGKITVKPEITKVKLPDIPHQIGISE